MRVRWSGKEHKQEEKQSPVQGGPGDLRCGVEEPLTVQ